MSEAKSSPRIEKDSLGHREIPGHVYYGIQTARAVENYPISGLRAHPALIRAIAMVKEAAALANRELGLVDEKTANAIIEAAKEVQQGKWDEHFVVDVFQAGAGVSFHMNSNEVIANRASELLGGARGEYKHVHPNDHVNYGQSTNDVFPTAMRLATLLELDRLYPALDNCMAALEDKGKEFHHVLKSGRTHMQDAVPMRLGQEFTAYAGAIKRAEKSIREQAELLREIGLGGGGGNRHQYASGLSPQSDRRAVAHLGAKLHAVDDMRFAMQSNLAMSSVSSGLRNLALEVIRISNDLRLLSSGPNTGLAEINLPALQPGSSIMPGKINPVMPELAAMVSFQVVGYDTAVALAVQAGQLKLNVMMPTMAYSVLMSITIMTNMLRQLTDFCIKGITVNEKRTQQYVQSTVSLATALNPYIGYAKAAEIAKESVKTGKSIIEIARERGDLSDGQIKEILDPARMTEPTAPHDIAKEREKIKSRG